MTTQIELLKKWNKRNPNLKKLLQELGQDEYILIMTQGLGGQKAIIEEFIKDLQSLQPTEEREVKRVKCWRCNCECGGHNIKYEYKYCPDCGGKIVD